MNLHNLLEKSEGDTLDYKRDNYRFYHANDEEKSELLKDILALANAWKATDAYIVIGVEETNGRPSKIVGVCPELSDSHTQQFVNSKTNRPVAFAIEHVEHVGLQLTIVHVSHKQARPIFLNKNYGRLRSNVVYVRRGSSTDEASPDEIAEMVKQDIPDRTPDVALRIQFRENAFSYGSDPMMPSRRIGDVKYFDGFELLVQNSGSALAKHIEGSIDLPSGILMNYADRKLFDKEKNPLLAIGGSKRIRLPFRNYLREPTHHYLAKPNPLEWMPLLPGREMQLLSERTLAVAETLKRIDARVTWELAVDDCVLRAGAIRLCDIPVLGSD
jgi:hypothetical protein